MLRKNQSNEKQKLKQRQDGRYACYYKPQTFYGHTPDESLKKREKYVDQIKIGLGEASLGITVSEYAGNWISTYKTGISDNTYNSYIRYLNHACAQIGFYRMQNVTASDIQRLYNSIDGKSRSYVRKYAMLIRHLFSSAVDDGVTLRTPCNKAKPPDGDQGTHRAIEQWERDLIASQIGKHDMAAAAMTMLYTGLRRGEVLALDIDRDVDFENDKLHVRGAVYFSGNTPIMTDTKTDAGCA